MNFKAAMEALEEAARAQERERCAKIAEAFGNVKYSDACQATANAIAQAIRAADER